jgi:hypothetical protein
MLPDYLFQYVFATSSAGKLEGNHPCSSPEVVSFAMIPNVASETPLIIFFTDIVVSLNFLKELVTQGVALTERRADFVFFGGVCTIMVDCMLAKLSGGPMSFTIMRIYQTLANGSANQVYFTMNFAVNVRPLAPSGLQGCISSPTPGT